MTDNAASLFDKAQKDAKERLAAILFLSLPDEVVQTEIEKVWKDLTTEDASNRYNRSKSQLAQWVEEALVTRVKERIEVVTSALTDDTIDGAILDKVGSMVEQASTNAKTIFWQAVGHHIVQHCFNQATANYKSCSCGRLYADHFNGQCPCGNYV